MRTDTLSKHRSVIAFGGSLAFLSFLDRAAISQAAPSIIRDLHLSSSQMGWVFSVFGITYAAGEIPSGWLCDRFGVRALLTRVVLLWSALTAATGVAWSYPSLLVARLLFGAGESGCFPGLARMFRVHLTPQQRNSGEGIKGASARWGAAIAPALFVALSAYFNWRQIFFLFGALGIVWALLFSNWYGRNVPAADSAKQQRPVSWTKLLRSRSVWALGVQWFCHYYGFYFYITWLPIYLYQVRRLDLRHESLAAGAPLLAAGLGSLLAGWGLSALSRYMGTAARARKLMAYVAYGGASVLLLLFTVMDNAALAMLAMSLSAFAAEFSGPASWTTAMDIGGEHVGTVSGFMNMMGHTGASVAPAVTGLLLEWSGNAWNITFYCSAAIYAAGALCWLFIDSDAQEDFNTLTPQRS